MLQIYCSLSLLDSSLVMNEQTGGGAAGREDRLRVCRRTAAAAVVVAVDFTMIMPGHRTYTRF